MSETTDSGQVVSPEPTEGTAGNANSSVDFTAVMSKLDEMNREIAQIKRGQQSVKDKAIAKMQQQIDEFRNQQKTALVQEGSDPDEAEEMVSRLLPPKKDAAPNPPSVGSAPGLDAVEKAILRDIPDDDPDVQAIRQRKYANPVQRTADLAQMVLSRNAPPDPAAVAPAAPTGSPSLEAQYKAEMLANRGKGYQVGNQIKDKYRKSGLNVDAISLTR